MRTVFTQRTNRRCEAQRVRLIVEPIDDDTHCADRTAVLKRLRDGIERMKFSQRTPAFAARLRS